MEEKERKGEIRRGQIKGKPSSVLSLKPLKMRILYFGTLGMKMLVAWCGLTLGFFGYQVWRCGLEDDRI